MAGVHDRVLTVRLPAGLLEAFRLAYGARALPGRVRYLIERDLRERARKHGGQAGRLDPDPILPAAGEIAP